MRVLLLFRGAPGCGKSTYIKEHGLEPYTLCADSIRLMYQSPQMIANGDSKVGFERDRQVWSTLFTILESRMQDGEFTVIDATNSRTEEMNKYKKLADLYRYRIYIIDMTYVPIEECKKRNLQRDILKQVPESAIDKMYARFKTQKIPSGIKVIKEDELDTIWYKPIDLSGYSKVVHIGDIHGCYTVLQEYLKNDLKDDVCYIFVGDYLDRGLENREVLKFLLSIYEKRNVILLTGNHELHLSQYAHSIKTASKTFEYITKKEIAEFNKKDLRQLCRKFNQCVYYKFHEKEVFVCHGGISNFSSNITFIPTIQMIKGVGNYSDMKDVADSWNRNVNGIYQIFGHRNIEKLPVQVNESVFSLEGRVEFGGFLRVVELNNEGFKSIEVQNTVYKEPEDNSTTLNSNDVRQVVNQLRHSKYVQEKNFGNYSSFNFTKEAFVKDKWNSETIHARGLFIDTVNNRIVARSYNKFFYEGQGDCPKFCNMSDRLSFPVHAYVKENGFLGMISYDTRNGELLFATKSSLTGDFIEWFKDIFYNVTDSNTRNKILNYVKENNCTLVFECIDTRHDPHIIEYKESNVILLDVIYNQIEFKRLPFEELGNVAEKFNLTCKEHAITLNNWSEFYTWYIQVTSDDYKYKGKDIEGFVVEDSDGFMFKLKCQFYLFWKSMRGMAMGVLRRGYITSTSSLTNDISNLFYGFLKDLYNTTEDKTTIPRDIITLRNMFYNK